ncbi:37014_t:CDS:2, partial [Gigaspora margarita]
TNFFERTNPIDFETVNNMGVKLMTSDTELSAETEPNDGQDLHILENIDLSDAVQIWELIGLSMVYKHYVVLLNNMIMNNKMTKFHVRLVSRHWYLDDQQDKKFEALQQESIGISTMFQQKASDIIVSDFHIIEQIRGANMGNAEQKQIISKKVIYASRFSKMKKALNLVLDFGYKKELLNMIARFINQKKAMLENINDEGIQTESEFVMDPLVTKFYEHPSTKRLKSSSEAQNYRRTIHNHAINPQDPNLKIPLNNIHTMDNNTKELDQG